jgi:predicted XRE-type DNA-binding protein
MAAFEKPKRRGLTSIEAAKIKYLAATTALFQHEIAAQIGLNQGRVSEVLNGKRFSDVSPHP